MTEPEEIEDDLFADLYDGDDAPAKNEEPALQPDPVPVAPPPIETSIGKNDTNHDSGPQIKDEDMYGNGQNGDISSGWNGIQGNDVQSNQFNNGPMPEEEPPRIGIKEDGKMFIGGLNWETTDQSLKEYFSQFGEVQECTVMRDGASGRSRGFGFLTFKNPRDVNAVMVKEHYLDGKIIDPKRAIPRDEQERTSKIFVGGVSQDATETIFKEYFAQYGRVVDATLMMDKDTGRPRGFGFVTFDSESAVDNTLNGDLTILGKPIEVKKAQPRGNMREDEDVSLGRGGPGGGRNARGGGRSNNNNFNDSGNNNQGNNQNSGGNQMGGMTPQMMAQYWAKMQQYFATMQQQMAMGQMGGGMGGGMQGMQGMGGMNPAMMAQIQQMQQMKAMQMAQQQQQQSQGRGSASPMPDAQGGEGGIPQGGMQGMMAGMNPAMMAQMGMNPAMMAQMQAQMQGGAGGGVGGMGGGGMSPTPNPSPGGPSIPPRRGTPGYNAQDQLAFEQQKYEQQQARRAAQESGMAPTSWEGMYEDVPPPGGGGGGGGGGELGPAVDLEGGIRVVGLDVGAGVDLEAEAGMVGEDLEAVAAVVVAVLAGVEMEVGEVKARSQHRLRMRRRGQRMRESLGRIIEGVAIGVGIGGFILISVAKSVGDERGWRRVGRRRG